MASPLNLANYDAINAEMGTLLSTGKYSGVTLTVYTNPAATNIAVINGINIDHLKIVKITCTHPYSDATTGVAVNGSISLDFGCGSTITAVDNVDNYWYTLEGIVFVPRTFGSA